jgi:uncharacterized protein (UPF0335 family)
MPQLLHKRAEPYVKRIENLLGQIETVGENAKRKKEPIREDIREVYAEAKAKGLKVPALKALIKLREMKRAELRIGNNLDEDAAADYEVLAEQLGDLGKWASSKRKAEAKPATDSKKEGRADQGALDQVGRGKLELVDTTH